MSSGKPESETGDHGLGNGSAAGVPEIRDSGIERREPGRVTMLQISDLHFTAETRTGRHGAAKERFLNEFQRLLLNHLEDSPGIDLILVTGDLVDSSARRAAREAALDSCLAYLLDLCQLLGVCKPAEAMIVIPGNHDYRWVGLKPSASAERDFNEKFRAHLGHRLYPNLGLFIGSFNSNVAEERVEWARGWVDTREFTSIQTTVRELEPRLLSAYGKARKLALVHHHPMPVAPGEDRSQSLWERAFFGKKMIGAAEHMVLKNSGQFIHHLMEEGYQGVFHGHYHHLSHWRPIASTPAGSRALEIVGCRSLGRTEGDRYGFNLISLRDEGDLEVRPFTYTAGGHLDPPAHLAVADYDAVRGTRWKPRHMRSSKGRATVKCRAHSLLYQVFLPGGNLQVSELIRELEVETGELHELRFFRESPSLSVDEFEAECLKDGIDTRVTTIEARAKSSGQPRFDHVITFEPALTPNNTPVTLRIERSTPGVLYVDRDDARAWEYSEEEDYLSHEVRIPTRQLSIRLLMHAHEAAAPEIQSRVWRPDDQPDGREKDSERFTESSWHPFLPDANEASSDLAIAVHVPITKYRYGFAWRIPQPSTASSQTADRQIRFWQLVSAAKRRELLVEARQLLKAFLNKHRVPATNAEVCLVGWAGDELRRETNGPLLEGYEPRWGRDISGAAFRSGKTIWFRRREDQGHPLALERVPQAVRAMIAMPLGDFEDAVERYRTVVVIALATDSDDDGLCRLSRQHGLVRKLDAVGRIYWEKLRSESPVSRL